MRFSSLASLTFGVAVLSGGCVADGRVHYGVHAAVIVPAPVVAVEVAPAPVVVEGAPAGEVIVQPDMVEVQPGVQVIADYDYPVFFSDGLYWRNDGGYWYSSHVYTGGWGRVDVAPARFANIHSEAYVHYRPAGYVARNRPVQMRDGGRIEPVRGGGEVRGNIEPVRGGGRVEPVRGGAEVHGNIEPVRGGGNIEPVRGGAEVHGNVEPVRGGGNVEPVRNGNVEGHGAAVRPGAASNVKAPPPAPKKAPPPPPKKKY